MQSPFNKVEQAVWRVAGNRFVEKNRELYGNDTDKYSWMTLVPEQYRTRLANKALDQYQKSFPMDPSQYLEFLAEKWVKRLLLLETLMATEDFTPVRKVDDLPGDPRQFIALTMNGSLVAAGAPNSLTGERSATCLKLTGRDFYHGHGGDMIRSKPRRITKLEVDQPIEVDDKARFSTAIAIFASPAEEGGIDLVEFSDQIRSQFDAICEDLYNDADVTRQD